MANSYTKIPTESETGYALHIHTMNTFATVAKDIDLGATSILLLHVDAASGTDFLMIWDDANPTAGTTAPDYQIPTTADCPIHVLSGMAFSNGLTFTVADVGGTACSTNPGADNVIYLNTDPV